MVEQLRMFPHYENICPLIPIDTLHDVIANGDLFELAMHESKYISEYPLGCFATDLTLPYNDLVVSILVDLNVIVEGSDKELYLLRVEDLSSDGVMDIKTDLESVKKAVDAIMSGKMPLHNITKNITSEMYDYIIV